MISPARATASVLMALPMAVGVGCSATNGVPSRFYSVPRGDQIVVLFLAGSSSRAGAAPGLREAVRAVHRKLQIEAERRGLALEFVGASLDWDVEDGIRFLRSYQTFDEVVVGGNWVNLAAIEYIWRDQPGSPIIPQIVLVRRHVYQHVATIDVGPDRVLGRFLGTEQIMEWARRPTHL